MTYLISDDERSWRDTSDRTLARHYADPQRAGETDDSTGFASATWRMLAELGALGLAIPACFGGVGAGLAESAAVASALGRAQTREPIDGHMTAAFVLAGVGGDAPAEWLPAMAEGKALVLSALTAGADGLTPVAGLVFQRDGDVCVRDGVLSLIPGAAQADAFLVAGEWADEPGSYVLALVRRGDAGLSTSQRQAVDRSALGDLSFAGTMIAESCVLATGADARVLVEAALRQRAILATAEIVGIVEGAIALVSDHVQTRQQFGGPLARLQSVAHNVAEMYADLEMIRSILRHAIVAQGSGAGRRLASAALSVALRSGISATERAVQAHGGMGVTDEHRIGHYYIRMLALRAIWGGASSHATALGQHWNAVEQGPRTEP